MEVSIKQKIVLDEIAGKNNAIQVYDQTLWKIRSGYLTLLFAGWGALLSFLADNGDLVVRFSCAMLCVSVGLSSAGLFIDLNYVRRKYRCIQALELLMADVFNHIDEPDAFKHKEYWRRISGDDLEREPAKVRGYYSAVLVLLLIYLVPLGGISGGVITLALWH